MKTQDELYQKSSLKSKIITSWTQIELAVRSTRYGETWSYILHYRIRGIPLTTLEQQDAKRENKVKKLIEKFEKHQRKEAYLKDLSQTQKINEFSKESQELIADLNNTESFELFRKFFQTTVS